MLQSLLKVTQLIVAELTFHPLYCKSPMVTVDRKGGSRGQGVPVLNSVSPFFNLVGQTLGLRGHVLS